MALKGIAVSKNILQLCYKRGVVLGGKIFKGTETIFFYSIKIYLWSMYDYYSSNIYLRIRMINFVRLSKKMGGLLALKSHKRIMPSPDIILKKLVWLIFGMQFYFCGAQKLSS